MVTLKIRLPPVFILVFLVLPLAYAATELRYDDDWAFNGGTGTDGIVWVDGDLYAYAYDVNSQADCLCWDWCDDGNWDNCYCESTTKRDQCRNVSSVVDSVCIGGNCWINTNLEYWHSVPTYQDGSCAIDFREYRACSGGLDYYDYDSKAHYAVDEQKFDCDADTGESSDDKSGTSYYDYEGVYYYDVESQEKDKNIVEDEICDSYRVCDPDLSHNSHDDQTSSSSSTLPDHPCTLEEGDTENYACDEDDDCYSDDCSGGGTQYIYICDDDGTVNTPQYGKDYGNTCGGQGYPETGWVYSSYHSCTESELGGSGYICDEEHDESSSTPCRKTVGGSCYQTTECWNDDGGNFCNSLYECTDGDVGRDCDENSDCYSNWCSSVDKCTDGANGRSCGSSSDCNSNYCCSSTCSASSCEEETDLAILDVIPIQVIPNVDMVKGKSGYVRVIVHNYGPLNATGKVNVTFEGTSLTPFDPVSASKFILVGANETFDFNFKPQVAGIDKVISASVSITD
jgi:hypothetical protein